MKYLILLVVTCIFFISCNKESRNPGIIIKGKIPIGNSSKSLMLKSKSSLSLTDAKKILVFNGLNDSGNGLNYSFVDIVDGSFSASAEMGTVAALVFLDAENKYIGTLSVHGLNLLPLGNLTEGENATIDLSTLTLVDNSVIPSHDPFGNEIIITDTEIKSLRAISGFFESLAKNLDTDNDGILDVLSNKQLFVKSHFEITVGHWGLNNSVPFISDSVLSHIYYPIEIFGDIGIPFPNTIVLSGPEDSPYNDIIKQWSSANTDGISGFNAGFIREGPPGTDWTLARYPFKKGTYTLTLDNKSLTFDFSNIDAKQNLVIVTPTLHTNIEGKLVSISLEYILPDKTIINPGNIINNVLIQLNDNPAHQIYTTPWLTNIKTGGNVLGLTSYTLDSPLDISALSLVHIEYNDMLGNMYVILWK